MGSSLNPIALRKAKIVYNFGLSECNRVKRKNFLLGQQNSCFYTKKAAKMKTARLLLLKVLTHAKNEQLHLSLHLVHACYYTSFKVFLF